MDWNDQLRTSLIWLGKAFVVSSIGLTITIYFLAQLTEWGRLVRRISWEYFIRGTNRPPSDPLEFLERAIQREFSLRADSAERIR